MYEQIRDVGGYHDRASMRFHDDLHRSPANVNSVAIWRKSRWTQALLAASVDHCHHFFSRSVLGCLCCWGDKLTSSNRLSRASPRPHEGVLCPSTGSIPPRMARCCSPFECGLHPRARLLLRRLLLASALHVESNNDKPRSTSRPRIIEI